MRVSGPLEHAVTRRSREQLLDFRGEVACGGGLLQKLSGAGVSQEATLQLPAAHDASALREHVAALDAELAFPPVEAAAMSTLLSLLTAAPGESVRESEYMAREARAFLPLLEPSLGRRFAYLARTGARPPRDLA
jgi:hypothetical protein